MVKPNTVLVNTIKALILLDSVQ